MTNSAEHETKSYNKRKLLKKLKLYKPLIKLLRPFFHILKKIGQFFGFSIVISNTKDQYTGYGPILPFASYSPWLTDSEFQKVHKQISKYTLIDQYRCYELWELVAQVAKLDGALLEVGTWRGGSSALIAAQAKRNTIADTVYLCDTFYGVVKATEEHDNRYRGGEHANATIEDVQAILAKLEVMDNTKILTGVFPDETADQITDTQFRFCHIDVDVYQSAKDTVEWLWPRLVIGGMIVYDDYGTRGCAGITKFVNEERLKDDRIVLYNLNGHAIVIKTK